MGLSFHYKGKLKEATSLKALIEEVQDIATSNNWEYFVFEDSFKKNKFSKKIQEHLYGISVSPPECEPFSLSFLSNGMMYDMVNFIHLDFDAELDFDPDFYISTKTQFSGFEIHKQLINLLAYVADKYLIDFECIDEGKYWETRDEALLKENFDRYTKLIDNLSHAVETIPMHEGESMEDYFTRITQATNEIIPNNTDELPELSLDEEIEFKKMKLSLEQDAFFPEQKNLNLPPEIENQFLDYVIDFDRQFKNAKKITVFERLGKPTFEQAENLTDEEIDIALEKLYNLMELHNLMLHTLCEYEDENRLLYTFITKELFHEEIDDIRISGMVSNFTYEDFYPNEAYNIEEACIDFIKMFLNKKSDFYKNYHFEDAKNHLEINAFRKLFKTFKILHYNFEDYSVLDKNAVANFSIEFTGKMKQSLKKVNFKGKGKVTLKNEYGFWYINELKLPI